MIKQSSVKRTIGHVAYSVLLTFLDVVQHAANFKTNSFVLIMYTYRLYKCAVPAGSTYVNDHSFNVVALAINVNVSI